MDTQENTNTDTNTNTELATVQPVEESHTIDLSQDLSQPLAEEGNGVAQAAEEAGQTLAPAATQEPQLQDPGVHPAQTSFLAQNKLYIAAGILGVVVITIAAGVMLSMGSSSRLQGMLDRRLMEQSSETNSLPESLNKTETFVEKVEQTEDIQVTGPSITAAN